MAKRRRTDKQKSEKQNRKLKEIAIATNSLEVGMISIKNILIKKGIATEEEFNEEWDKIWQKHVISESIKKTKL